jgi:hypothetical protein
MGETNQLGHKYVWLVGRGHRIQNRPPEALETGVVVLITQRS